MLTRSVSCWHSTQGEISGTVKQEHQNKHGEKFGAIFHGMWNNWAAGLMRTNEFRELFGDTEQVELLNARIGGGFHWLIDRSRAQPPCGELACA